MKHFKAMSKRKKIVVSILSVIGIYLLYVILCVTLPFIGSPDVNQEYKDNFNINEFYSDTVGVDRACVIETSQDALDIRMNMIEQAQTSIIFSTFSIKTDQSSQEIVSLLYAAAQRGVKVQIIIDGLSGSFDMKNDPMFYVLGTHPNVEIRYYNNLSLIRPWTANGRLHDKYIIIDDQLLLLGGRNTSNYFLGNYNTSVLSYDRDIFVYNTDSLVTNSVIAEVKDYFLTVWNCNESEQVFDTISNGRKKKVQEARVLLENTYQRLKEEQSDLFAPMDYTSFTLPTNKITLITNPIHIMSKQPYIWYDMMQLMKHANDRVIIQTPYAVLNGDMYADLSDLNDMVPNVTMLLNSRAGGDNICASIDYTFNQSKVIDTGITLYEFQGQYSMHDKSVLIDDDISIIGSFNFDMRSTYLDTEVMLVVHGTEFNDQLESCMMVMKDQSLPVLEDGSYGTNGNVTALTMGTGKKMLYGIGSVFFQLFRYLL